MKYLQKCHAMTTPSYKPRSLIKSRNTPCNKKEWGWSYVKNCLNLMKLNLQKLLTQTKLYEVSSKVSGNETTFVQTQVTHKIKEYFLY